jgi:hypothetical protein
MCDSIYYIRNINEPDYYNCSGYPFLASRVYFLVQDPSYSYSY